MTITRTMLCAIALAACGIAPGAAHPQDEKPAQPQVEPAESQPESTDPSPTRPRLTLEQKREIVRRHLERLANQQLQLRQALDEMEAGRDPGTLESIFGEAEHTGEIVERIMPMPAHERGGPGGGRHGRPDREPISPGDREAIREILQLAYPPLVDRLDELERTDPEEAQRRYAEAAERLDKVMELRRKDPQLYELRLEDFRLEAQARSISKDIAVRHLGGAGETETLALRKQLEKVLDEQYFVHLKMKTHEISGMQKQLESLQTEQQTLLNGRDSYIKDKTERLIAGSRGFIEKMRERRGGPGRRGDRRGPDGPPPRIE